METGVMTPMHPVIVICGLIESAVIM
jgi:hypothetical protein